MLSHRLSVVIKLSKYQKLVNFLKTDVVYFSAFNSSYLIIFVSKLVIIRYIQVRMLFSFRPLSANQIKNNKIYVDCLSIALYFWCVVTILKLIMTPYIQIKMLFSYRSLYANQIDNNNIICWWPRHGSLLLVCGYQYSQKFMVLHKWNFSCRIT